MSKVALGMSGGVDSSVAIHLLQKQGHDVVGIHLLLANNSETTGQAQADAQAVADLFHIPMHVIDLMSVFEQEVVQPFIQDYAQAKTPNPCIRCNEMIKFGKLWELAQSLGCSHLATGHYVRLKPNKENLSLLCKAVDSRKDQSYFLYRIHAQVLPHLIFPLGNYHKTEVRAIASELKLPIASKSDSQEICFIPEDDYIRFLQERKITNFADQEGSFVNETGDKIGRHNGLYRYTIGQRKGLGLALGYPAYVTNMDANTRQITIGKGDQLWRKELIASECSFFIPVEAGLSGRAHVKIRSRDQGASASWSFDGKDLHIYFDEAVRAITPGQSAVLYDDDCILGGGIIQAF